MQTECPACAAEITITVEGDVTGFPIRVEWNSEIPSRCAGVVVADSHEPVEIYYSTDDEGWSGCELRVMYDHESQRRDMYGQPICIVHVCEGGGEAGDRARSVYPPPSRPTST